MPSPFPGMDPYLEGTLWPDVHASLIVTIRGALVAVLPEGYIAGIDEYLWLAEDEEKDQSRRGQPDAFVSVVSKPAMPTRPSSVAIAEPTARTKLPAPRRVRRKRFIRLVDAADNTVVTVIELLSPSEKLPKKDRMHYLAKRDEYLAAGTNVVEIDLLRKGHRIPLGEPDPPAADYYFLVSRASDYPTAEIWGFNVQETIPIFPVPLRPEHDSVPLDLRACLDEVYDKARYDKRIDYSLPPDPPLRRPDAEWAAELLKK
ncbi:MAG TPA: DUF4058 family protein, partial [Gemmata sp.]|nr:DUF4058 family protein [Gemmata sp.]